MKGVQKRKHNHSKSLATTRLRQHAQRESFFHRAHSFSVNNPVMVGELQIVGEQSGHLVLGRLELHALSGVEYNSLARAPAPCCYQGTRLQLFEDIRTWLGGPNSKQKLLWIYGPAGVGKSAILQTLADFLEKESLLGATLFFPWPYSQELHSPSALNSSIPDVSSAIWLTIAYRLATKLPLYRKYLIERLQNDPKLVESTMKHQFDVLIKEPFGQNNLVDGDHCLPILIDGIDRCTEHDAQQELILTIVDFVENYPKSPLVWIITSRSEMHLMRTFDKCYARLERQVKGLPVPIDSDEARRDVRYFMEQRFASMLEEFAIELSPWPAEEDFNLILCVVSGLFILVTSFLSFIGNPGTANPVSQLQNVVSTIRKDAPKDQARKTEAHPSLLAPVYDMYTQILSKVPESSYHTAKRILGFYLLPDGFGAYARDSIPFWYLCNILKIEQHVAYGCLFHLHSLLDVPDREQATVFPLRFYHESFADYLLDQEAADKFWIDIREVQVDLWECHLRILREANRLTRPIPRPSRIRLAWPSPFEMKVEEFQSSAWENARLVFFHHLLPYRIHHCTFGAEKPDFSSVEGQSRLGVLKEIDFCNLIDGYVNPDAPFRFIAFLHWLLEEGHSVLRESGLLFQLKLPDNNDYAWVNTDAVSFIIHCKTFDGDGCTLDIKGYTDLDFRRLNEIESSRLLSTNTEPKEISHLLERLEEDRAHITDAVVVGPAEVGQCAVLANKSMRDETVYYILPYLNTVAYKGL